MSRLMRTLQLSIVLFMLIVSVLAAAEFTASKTLFQTNLSYDPRIAIAVDGVIVHRHGASKDHIRRSLGSWREHGFSAGRMFFADSDAGNVYWTGKWDGQPRPGDVERNQQGEVVKCANVRPYMLPTQGWIDYLKEMTTLSLDVSAEAILPEEPLAHVHTGYEDAFKQLWQRRYNTPWQGQHVSEYARYLTAQLKNELYIDLEHQLMTTTKDYAQDKNKPVGFVLPIHALYSNIAANLVAPLGTSIHLEGVDGYIGQIWTGPVNWALGHYHNPNKSFFTSAYALYDYFTQLTVRSDKNLWLLIDPVEDNPDHSWDAFAQWYKHCAVAMLLMQTVDRYEITPWPDRIFLPGHSTGGKTPAPEDYRTVILAVTQVLQEVPLGGQWLTTDGQGGLTLPSQGIGIATADTLMWSQQAHPRLQEMYSLLLPLIARGIPVSSFLMERSRDKSYLADFKVIVVSYESFKPLTADMNHALVGWCRGGGTLIVLGNDGDALDNQPELWWQKSGFSSPLAHLLSELKQPRQGATQWALGNGHIFRSPLSLSKTNKAFSPARDRAYSQTYDNGEPCATIHSNILIDDYLALVAKAWGKNNANQPLNPQGGFALRRGPYIIAHSEFATIELPGRLIDVFDPELKEVSNVRLAPGQSGLYKELSVVRRLHRNNPCVLHATHRLMSQQYDKRSKTLTFTLRGPEKTPALARLDLASHSQYQSIVAEDAKKQSVQASVNQNDTSLLVSFPNDPAGVTVTLVLETEK